MQNLHIWPIFVHIYWGTWPIFVQLDGWWLETSQEQAQEETN